MRTYLPSTDIPVTFSLVDEAGSAIIPTSLQWRLLDELNSEVVSWTSVLSLPASSEFTTTIISLYTGLPAGEYRGLRTIEARATVAGGAFHTFSETVIIQASSILGFGVNTFMTYEQALMASLDFVPTDIQGWIDADKSMREQALIGAYENILRLPLVVEFDNIIGQSMLIPDAPLLAMSRLLRDMTPTEMGHLSPRMSKALKKAQIAEAANILNGDPVTAARNNGLISMTVGESSQFFRTQKPLDLPVCPKAMAYLSRWVRFSARIGRS